MCRSWCATWLTATVWCFPLARCASQIARNGTTGELVWAFNMTPADNWDEDEPLITPLIDGEVNGQMRQLAVKAARNGWR